MERFIGGGFGELEPMGVGTEGAMGGKGAWGGAD